MTPTNPQQEAQTSEARPDLNRTITAEENNSNAIDLLVNGRPFATIIDEDGNDVTDEMRAYAALFVAAPELLEAAKMAKEFIERIANTMAVAANGESLTLLKLGYAIDKAEKQP